MDQKLMRSIAVALTLVASATACSASSDAPVASVTAASATVGPTSTNLAPPTSTLIQPSVTSAITAPDQDELPPAEMLFAAEDEATLLYAEQVLTGRCMERLGFPYIVPAYEEVLRDQRNADGTQREQFPYVADTEGVPYQKVDYQPLHDQNGEYAQTLGESEKAAYSAALGGTVQQMMDISVLGTAISTPRDGCYSAARVELYGDLTDALSAAFIISNLRPQIHARVRSDAAVIDAFSAWSSCMASTGFPSDNFSQARAQATSQPDLAIALATADAACTESSNLAALYNDAYAREQQEFVEENQEAFRAFTATRNAAIDRARVLLGR